jgi:hypothetical protein
MLNRGRRLLPVLATFPALVGLLAAPICATVCGALRPAVSAQTETPRSYECCPNAQPDVPRSCEQSSVTGAWARSIDQACSLLFLGNEVQCRGCAIQTQGPTAPAPKPARVSIDQRTESGWCLAHARLVMDAGFRLSEERWLPRASPPGTPVYLTLSRLLI